jgi:tRNA G10  N-methylase Trm11
MDAEDLFRKLASGAKFNFKKYTADAQKLKVCVVFATKLCTNFLIYGIVPYSFCTI